MKTFTIVPGVTITFDEDCDKCIELEAALRVFRVEKDIFMRVHQDVLSWSLKTVKNNWDQGYNQCLHDVKKRLSTINNYGF